MQEKEVSAVHGCSKGNFLLSMDAAKGLILECIPGLPAGFFDNGPTTEEIKKEEDEPMSVDDPNDPEVFYRGKETKPAPAPKINSAETLPEGFFDDPVQDAKVIIL